MRLRSIDVSFIVRLLHSSQKPRAAPSNDATPQTANNQKVSSVAHHAKNKDKKKKQQSRSNHVNPPTAGTADTEQSPHFFTAKCQPIVTKYLITRHEPTVTLAHTLLHFPGETGAKGRALMSPQSEGLDGCCRRNQRAIHTANRPVYIL